MSQIPAIASTSSINREIKIITAKVKVLLQYAALSIADKDIYILLEDIYDSLKALDLNDLDNVYDKFVNLKADFTVLAYYEREVTDHVFGDSMFSIGQRLDALDTALDNRVSFECAVNRLQKVGAVNE